MGCLAGCVFRVAEWASRFKFFSSDCSNLGQVVKPSALCWWKQTPMRFCRGLNNRFGVGVATSVSIWGFLHLRGVRFGVFKSRRAGRFGARTRVASSCSISLMCLCSFAAVVFCDAFHAMRCDATLRRAIGGTWRQSGQRSARSRAHRVASVREALIATRGIH